MQKEKLTILVPFKNREENLKVFIPYMNNYMSKNFSKINYQIVIVEQCNDLLFNKGILFNAGFLLTSGNTDYYALHDIDELPISAEYSYNPKPVHLCVNIYEQNNNGKIENFYYRENDDGFKHRGGCVIINNECYIKANGHSNLFWGWGTIDINFAFRLDWTNNSFIRYKFQKNNDSGYYISLKTTTLRFQDSTYIKNLEIENKYKNNEIDWKRDGLNNIQFKLLGIDEYDGYKKYKIDFDYKTI